jgi:hypothetical protein
VDALRVAGGLVAVAAMAMAVAPSTADDGRVAGKPAFGLEPKTSSLQESAAA